MAHDRAEVGVQCDTAAVLIRSNRCLTELRTSEFGGIDKVPDRPTDLGWARTEPFRSIRYALQKGMLIPFTKAMAPLGAAKLERILKEFLRARM